MNKILTSLLLIGLLAFITINYAEEGNKIMSIYNYSVKNAKNEDVKLADYNGKVILIVNTATGCGFTPHYEQLESMYKKFHDKGLEIIDIPCNQFGGQAPGTDDEIHQFCTLHYNTTFPQMKKSEVNCENEMSLYTYLKQQKGFEGLPEGKYSELLIKMFKEKDPDYDKKPDIKWNFTKFVVNRKGEVVRRFEPTADMNEVEKFVESLL